MSWADSWGYNTPNHMYNVRLNAELWRQNTIALAEAIAKNDEREIARYQATIAINQRGFERAVSRQTAFLEKDDPAAVSDWQAEVQRFRDGAAQGVPANELGVAAYLPTYLQS